MGSITAFKISNGLRPAMFAQVLGIAFVLLSTHAGKAYAGTVEAKKDSEIYTEATNKSAVLGKLAKGDTLESIERKGMFWQVKMKDGKAGFISALAVGIKADGGSGLGSAIKSVVKEGRQNDDENEGRQRSSVMGVRGLTEDDSAGNAGTVRPNLRAVYAMEDQRVSPKEVEKLGNEIFAEIQKKVDRKSN